MHTLVVTTTTTAATTTATTTTTIATTTTVLANYAAESSGLFFVSQYLPGHVAVPNLPLPCHNAMLHRCKTSIDYNYLPTLIKAGWIQGKALN